MWKGGCHCLFSTGFPGLPLGSSAMNTPKIAQRSPLPVTVEAGKTYHWCSCGCKHSAKGALCDGTHKTLAE